MRRRIIFGILAFTVLISFAVTCIIHPKISYAGDSGCYRVTLTQSCWENGMRYYTIKDTVTEDYYMIVIAESGGVAIEKLDDK